MICEKKEYRIIVRTEFEGLHSWKNAPEEVSYLKNQHRHIFHVEATISVTHNDRELEFIMVKHEINSAISDHIAHCVEVAEHDDTHEVNLGSCEMMCDVILGHLQNKYGPRYYDIKVFEDGENGGEVICDMEVLK